MKNLSSLLVAATLATAATSALASSGGFVVPLTISGPDLDARGSVTASFNKTRSTLTVTASKLNPSQPCQLLVDGQVEGIGTTSRSGSVTLRFRSPDLRGYQRLDFEPRGKTLVLQVGGTSVLSGVFSGPGEAPKSAVSESADLTNLVPGSRATAIARHTLSASGVAVFTVTLSRALVAPVTLLVNGQPLGAPLTPNSAGNLTFRFRAPTVTPGFAPLTVDPRGATLDLVQDGSPILTGEMRARARGINFSPRNSVLLPIPSAQTPPAGSAKAKWSIDQRARRKFSVEIEDVPEGTYDLFVNSVLRGSFDVTDTGDDIEGEIEFSSSDDDGEELPLDFDPLGAELSIRDRASIVWFTGVFDPSTLGTRPPAEPASRFDETLASTGVDANAKAEARYEVDSKGRHRFKIEVEDVDAGTYGIRVGGVHRGSLRAVLVAGTVEGEVEFRTPSEPGKIPLSFDPRGQLVEIVGAGETILFSHVLGSGSATSGPGAVVPFLVSTHLLAENNAAGSILALFELDDDGDRKFKLKARGLPVGSYSVSVGGTTRGNLTVITSGDHTEGELEFETDPDAGELLLNFAVLDQEITVSDSNGVLFRRTLTQP